jgi:peptidoglycan lytic transglycosylase D
MLILHRYDTPKAPLMVAEFSGRNRAGKFDGRNRAGEQLMKVGGVLALLLAGSLVARAQNDTVTLPDIIQGAQQWAQDNLDTNVLNALSEADNRAVRQFFRDAQQRFQGDYVVDMAALGQTAQAILPLLESREETQPYAAWLKARMDYLDVADEIRLTIPPPKSQTNQPPRSVPNPPPQKERELWVKKVSAGPWPALAREYVPELKPIFTAQQIPPELVWVAEVESGFDRRALSPAGAAGLFQLMPDTAKRFGLSLWPRDQRYQAEPNATASAHYLKYLHDRFKDWQLALAAYNAGEGTVQKLLDRYKSGSYDEIAEHLPAQTQMYVPRVEAVLWQREGAKLEQLSPPQR